MLKSFKQTLLLRIISYAIVAVVLIVATILLSLDISRRLSLIKEVGKKLAFRFQSTETLANLKQSEDQAKRDLLFLESRLPIQDKLLSFPPEMAALAQKYGVTAKVVFSSETLGLEDQPGSQAFSLAADGSLNNWINFLEAMEKSRYLINFQSFNLAGKDDSLKTTINGKVFFQ